MRVALYARVSTRRQAQAQTVEQQLERLTDHARQQGWDVPLDPIFRDDGYSGASLRRPGLDRLRDRAAARTLDLVVITRRTVWHATTSTRSCCWRSWKGTAVPCGSWTAP